MIPNGFVVSDEVRLALQQRRGVVALESTLIAHGLPWPVNVETARTCEQVIRESGAIPATIAIWKGQITIGISSSQIEALALEAGVKKASRRDLAAVISQQATAATTVAGTMFLAHKVGIPVFATGGIGGAHRDPDQPFDISADLVELSRTPVLVVSAGAKSILDLPRTLEILETLGVPVVGYGTNQFPGFYLADSGLPVPIRVETAQQAAHLFATHQQLNAGGMLLTQPIHADVAIPPDRFQTWLQQAEQEAHANNIRGAAITPFLLKRLAEISQGRTLQSNQALIIANAKLAAAVTVAMTLPVC